MSIKNAGQIDITHKHVMMKDIVCRLYQHSRMNKTS